MITTETVASLLKRHLPEWKVTSITPLGRGRRWEVFKGTEQCGVQVVVRVREPKQGDIPPPRALLERLEDHDEAHTAIYGYEDALWYEVRFGDYHRCPVSEGACLGAYLTSLVGTLRGLHRDQNLLWDASLFTTQWWTDSLRCALEDSLTYLHDHELLLGDMAGCMLSTLTRALGDITPTQTSLLHGDLSPRNVLLATDDPTKVVGLIDWDDAHLGDYMWDLAGLACFHDEDPERDALYARILREYHRLSTDEAVHPSLWHRFWTYYVCHAARRLADHHRRDLKMDLTRGVARLEMGYGRLTSLR